MPVEDGSFGAWLRALPIKPGRPMVRLHDGRLKSNQEAHHVVIDIDVGRRDLQQCADAVMRLRAEYLWARNQHDRICFRFTSGDALWWKEWRTGVRPMVRGNRVTMKRTQNSDDTYASFRKYLEQVFTYAGTHSLRKELEKVADPLGIAPGDVLIQGGFPGHAVIVVDVAERSDKKRAFLLAQSYMPAQEIHVLRNPASADSPWYLAESAGRLVTPEWTFFRADDLFRFSEQGCPRVVQGSTTSK